MSTSITVILATDAPADSRSVINANFASLNTNKVETSAVGTTVAQIVKTGIAKISGGAQQYGIPGTLFLNQGTTSLSANNVRYVPFFVPYPVTLTQAIFEVTTGPSGTGHIRFGIYAADTNMQPTGAPIWDSGSTSVPNGFTGTATLTSFSVALTAGAYVLCANVDAAMSLRTFISASPVINANLGTSSMIQRFDASQTYAAFPATPTAWTSVNATAGGLQNFIAFQWTE